MMLSRSHMTIALRTILYLVSAAVLIGSLAPVTGQPGTGVDKIQHLGAFYVLTLLALAAHPRRKLYMLVMALAAFGALIEILQGLAIFSRDRDIADWVADMLGVTLALAPLLPAAWRRRAGASQ